MAISKIRCRSGLRRVPQVCGACAFVLGVACFGCRGRLPFLLPEPSNERQAALVGHGSAGGRLGIVRYGETVEQQLRRKVGNDDARAIWGVATHEPAKEQPGQAAIQAHGGERRGDGRQGTVRCCLCDGTCVDITEELCLAKGGIPGPPGSDCDGPVCGVDP